MCGHGLLCSWPWSLLSLLGSGLFWLTWPPPRKVSAGLLEPWPCSGQALGLLPAGARTQLSPPCLCPPGGPLSSEPLGGWGLRTVSTAARLAHTAWSAAPTRAVGLKRHTSALSENSSILVFQEAEAFALYHKALDLQKHDRFEESAKAYHELLEARLLREVSAPGFPMCGTPSLLQCSKVGRVQSRARHSLPAAALCPLSAWRRPCGWLRASCFGKRQSTHAVGAAVCAQALGCAGRAGRVPSLSCCPDGLQTASRGSGLSLLCAQSCGGGGAVLERPPGPHCSPVEGGCGLAPRPAQRPGPC